MTTKTRRLIPPRHELVGDLSSIVGRSTWLTSGFTDGLAGYRLTGLSLVGPPGGGAFRVAEERMPCAGSGFAATLLKLAS
jgi:hypothetical protein